MCVCLQFRAQSADWLALEEFCQSEETDPTGRDNDYWAGNYVPMGSLALCFVTSGTDMYARRAVAWLPRINNQPRGDDARSGYYYVGLTYDWLYNHPVMTATVKQQFRSTIKTISDHTWQTMDGEGRRLVGGDTDEISGLGLNYLLFGLALYGDEGEWGSRESQIHLNRAWWLWTRGRGSTDRPGKRQDHGGEDVFYLEGWICSI